VTMKNLLSLSPSKIFVICGLGLSMTLGAFWQQQSNQVQIDRMNVLNQGVNTCFNRISQSFTAMMIKDIQSPYLQQGFMSLSDDCFNEVSKGTSTFRSQLGTGYDVLTRLLSDVHWFHESLNKIHAPMMAGMKLDAPLSPLSEKFAKIENFKTTLVDSVDTTAAKLREIQKNDEILMGIGLIIFVLSLSVLSLQEFNRLQLQKEIERQALNLLKAGQANVGAIVDQLVERALVTQNMTVTAQIFKDYHGNILERMAMRSSSDETIAAPVKNEKAAEFVAEAEGETALIEDTVVRPKSSLKEILVSLQTIQGKENMQISDVRDVQVQLDYESLEQIMNSAISKLATNRTDGKKIMVSNQIHSDRTIVNLFLAKNAFLASELEYMETNASVSGEIDMNLMILKEIAQASGVTWNLENKTDRDGNITGMNIRFVMNRVPKESRAKNLISVVRGKKKDLAREMMN
jgi:hypothetical protein